MGKESACNAGDPGPGRSPGEGIGYPLLYSWASLVAQLVKNLPATWETWLQCLGSEDPPEKGEATHSSILAWRSPWTVHGVAKSWPRLSDFHHHYGEILFMKIIKKNLINACVGSSFLLKGYSLVVCGLLIAVAPLVVARRL